LAEGIAVKLFPKIFLGLSFMTLPAFCGSIGMDEWYTFSWNGGVGTDAFALGPAASYTGNRGTSITGIPCGGPGPCDSFSQPFTFSGATTLFVQDLFFAGDQFQIYDNGVLLAGVNTTSTPTPGGLSCGDDPLGCPSPKWSSGTFSLGAGSHAISIKVVAEAIGFTTGRGVLELFPAVPAPESTTVVPEPASLSMMGLGLGALLLGWRCRQKP
jgi:hypothetical protein